MHHGLHSRCLQGALQQANVPHKQCMPTIVQMADTRLMVHNHLQPPVIRTDLLQIHDGHFAYLVRWVVQLRNEQLQRPCLDRRLDRPLVRILERSAEMMSGEQARRLASSDGF